MVKPKQRHKHRAPSKKEQQNQVATNFDPPDEHDWMLVKKQRITILIPPLPNKVQCAKPNLLHYQLQGNPRNTNSHSSKQSVNETEKSTPLSEKRVIYPPITVHPPEPNSTFQNPPSLSHRVASDNSPISGFREGKDIVATSKGSKRMMIFANSSAFLSQRMRASYLEKKLKKAGGLGNWLISLGLARFVKVFETRRVNKFLLANLTMKKLKDMGLMAVGPRRKLMHAIDCLCQPHCFRPL